MAHAKTEQKKLNAIWTCSNWTTKFINKNGQHQNVWTHKMDKKNCELKTVLRYHYVYQCGRKRSCQWVCDGERLLRYWRKCLAPHTQRVTHTDWLHESMNESMNEWIEPIHNFQWDKFTNIDSIPFDMAQHNRISDIPIYYVCLSLSLFPSLSICVYVKESIESRRVKMGAWCEIDCVLCVHVYVYHSDAQWRTSKQRVILYNSDCAGERVRVSERMSERSFTCSHNHIDSIYIRISI